MFIINRLGKWFWETISLEMGDPIGEYIWVRFPNKLSWIENGPIKGLEAFEIYQLIVKLLAHRLRRKLLNLQWSVYLFGAFSVYYYLL